jgi:hypothetical protein
MTSYPPPTRDVPTFNPNNFPDSDGNLTLAEADARYLKLTGGILTGALNVNSSTSTQSLNVDGTANFIAGTGSNIIAFPDNLAVALDFKQGANSYMHFDSTNGTEKIVVSKDIDINASLELDSLTVDQLALDNSTITFSGTTGNNIISMADNLADAFSVNEAANSYIKCTTTNGSEAITLGKATTVSAALTANSLVIDQIAADDGIITFSGTTGNNKIVVPDNLTDALTMKDGSSTFMSFRTTTGSKRINTDVNIISTAAVEALTVRGGECLLSGSDIYVQGTNNATVIINDNSSTAWRIREGSNNYLTFCTTNSAEEVQFGKKTSNTSQPCLYINATADQTLTTGTPTLITFNTPSTVFSQGTDITFSAGSFTCATAGVYLVNVTLTWEANATGTRQLYINKSNSTVNSARYAEAVQNAVSVAANTTRQNATAFIMCAASATICVWGGQSSGGDLKLLANASGTQLASCQASVVKLF